jgi:WD40 repeat protein
VTIRDVASGVEVVLLRGGLGPVVYSADGRRLATGNEAGAKVWDSATGKEVSTVKTTLPLWLNWADNDRRLLLQRPGRFMVSEPERDTLTVADPITGKVLGTAPVVSSHGHVAVTRDGRRVASAVGAFGDVGLWSPADRERPLLLRHPSLGGAQVSCVAFSPDGQRLAAGDWAGQIRFWDAPRTWSFTIPGEHASGAIVFSPDSRRLACAEAMSRFGPITVWDLATARTLPVAFDPAQGANRLAYSPDGRLLAAARSGEVKVWEAAGGKAVFTISELNGQILALAFSPDGRLLAGHSGNEIRLWDSTTGKLVTALQGHRAQVVTLAFSPDGRLLASGAYAPPGKRGEAKLWDVAAGKELRALEDPAHQVGSLAFSPDGRFLATGTGELYGAGQAPGEVTLWDVGTGRPVQSLRGHTRNVRCVAWSPDGHRLASGGDDWTVKIWDPATGRLLGTLRDHTWEVRTIAFSPDNAWLASASETEVIVRETASLPAIPPPKP